MPETIKLEDGSTREVPTTEELNALQEKAKKADDINYKTMRESLDKAHELLRQKGEKIDDKGNIVPPSVTPEVVQETSKKAAEEVFKQSRAEEINRKRDRLLNELSRGDENKKKVIEEKYNKLKGEKVITETEELEALMDDAVFLANKNNVGQKTNPLQRVSSGEPNITPIQSTSSSRSRGVELAEGFGYNIKNRAKITN